MGWWGDYQGRGLLNNPLCTGEPRVACLASYRHDSGKSEETLRW
jgi:hypothetical protein